VQVDILQTQLYAPFDFKGETVTDFVINYNQLLMFAHDLSPNMTCHQILNMSNMTGVTNGARNACPSGAPEEVVLIIL
jgi:hypothetical protein